MSAPPETPPGAPEPPATSETTALLMLTFADLHRQEVAAEEDVYRTLPFFGTALAIAVGALAYAGGRLPRWPDLSTQTEVWVFALAAVLLGLAFIEAACVLVLLSRAVTRRPYKRIGPEPALLARLEELKIYYEKQGTTLNRQDGELVKDMRQVLLESYSAVTPINRSFNERRYKHRAWAAINLVGSLIFALLATTVIFSADKIGFLPKVIP